MSIQVTQIGPHLGPLVLETVRVDTSMYISFPVQFIHNRFLLLTFHCAIDARDHVVVQTALVGNRRNEYQDDFTHD